MPIGPAGLHSRRHARRHPPRPPPHYLRRGQPLSWPALRRLRRLTRAAFNFSRITLISHSLCAVTEGAGGGPRPARSRFACTHTLARLQAGPRGPSGAQRGTGGAEGRADRSRRRTGGRTRCCHGLAGPGGVAGLQAKRVQPRSVATQQNYSAKKATRLGTVPRRLRACVRACARARARRALAAPPPLARSSLICIEQQRGLDRVVRLALALAS